MSTGSSVRLRRGGVVPVSVVARREESRIERIGRIPWRVVGRFRPRRSPGAVAAATVRSAGQVTHTALTLTSMLTAEEERLIGICPLGEARYRALVVGTQFTAVAAAEIANLAW